VNRRQAAKHLTALALMALLVGCSGSNTVSMSDPEADFSQYKTYNFVQSNAEYKTIASTYLQTSTAREMEARGFTKSDEPDVVINFSFDEEEKIRTRQVPSARGGMGYDPYYDVYYDSWGTNHQTQIDQYTEGKLDIDLIDVAQRKLVWQGTTKGRLTKKDYANAQKTLDTAVVEIFQEFPITIPSS
jgi:hypothetical protein